MRYQETTSDFTRTIPNNVPIRAYGTRPLSRSCCASPRRAVAGENGCERERTAVVKLASFQKMSGMITNVANRPPTKIAIIAMSDGSWSDARPVMPCPDVHPPP